MLEKIKNFDNNSKYLQLLNNLENHKSGSCFGLNLNEISFILSSIKKQKILVVNTINDALKYETQLNSSYKYEMFFAHPFLLEYLLRKTAILLHI